MRVYILASLIILATAASIVDSEPDNYTVWTFKAPKGTNIVSDLCLERLRTVLAPGPWKLNTIT